MKKSAAFWVLRKKMARGRRTEEREVQPRAEPACFPLRTFAAFALNAFDFHCVNALAILT